MAPDLATWIASIRAETAHPDFFAFAVKGECGTVLIWREDIDRRTDEELLAFIARRTNTINSAA